MATLEKGHYHCIECGSLFEAEIKSSKDQRCPVCDHPPTGKLARGNEPDRSIPSVVRAGDTQLQGALDLHGVRQDAKDIAEATIEAQNNKLRGKVKRTKRKDKKSKKIWLMLCVWLALLTLIVGLVKYFNPEESESAIAAQVDLDRARIIAQAEAKKNKMMVQAAAPSCEKVMTAFLNAPSAAAKAQYVYQGASLSGTMTRYYRNNPSFSSTRSQIRIQRGGVLDIPGQKAIGTVCLNTLGERFEAIFIFSENEWKIDWKSLVRYDERPWSLFQAGRDGDEGEFRLYMRVRDTDEDLESKDMSVVFYKPTMYTKNEFRGLASMSVSVPIDSPLGEKIQALLDSEEESDTDAFGYSIKGLDPLGYHRVRARIRLHREEGEEATMELIEIIANHWYGEEVISSDDLPAENGE